MKKLPLDKLKNMFDKMPQDIKSALRICVFASILTTVMLTSYREAAGYMLTGSGFPGGQGTVGNIPSESMLYDTQPKTDPGAAEVADAAAEETAVLCMSDVPTFIEMGEGDEYEAARELLARLISAEVGDQSYICQVAFGAMILNRMKSPLFPESLDAVIYQAGAFASVSDRRFSAAPSERALHAARDALSGSDPGSGALYCFRSDDTLQMKKNGDRITVTLGNICFYK